MSNINYKKLYAIKKKNEQIINSVNPHVKNMPGIYFLTREDENGIKYFYIGQSVKVLDRMVSHLSGYQHIDLSIKKRGWYSEENPYGWKLNVNYYPEKRLDELEQYYILKYTQEGYQCRYNKTAGGQGVGKEKINEYRPSKGYRDGLEQGFKNASKMVAHLFELHLDVKTKSENPNKNQEKALQKFKDFLDAYKS